MNELDRVLGGGIVHGSLILVGGDPGIGKSTIMLQICDHVKPEGKILYVSGEESIRQIRMRASRLKITNNDLFLLSETNFKTIERHIDEIKPKLVIIDSIQTVYNDDMESAPGSVSQVKDITSSLMRIAKNSDISVIIVGHVTKEGAIAGPRVLEHMVDTVLYFEGDRHLNYRILRVVKNRFGSTNEIGIFEMREEGLVEVANPSETMLSGRPVNVAGSAVVCSLEGTRPMLVELQALVTRTSFGMPRRMAQGFDNNRLSLLLAVLEKKAGLDTGSYDAYINVVGGLKLVEPACDLGVVAAIASSFSNVPCDPDAVFIGEVGLTGEIRAVNQIEKRIREASRMGFKNCYIPDGNYNMLMKNSKKEFGINIVPVDSILKVI
jgi:DNA repair protein RadA/Sms